jgi:ribosomal protein S3AE
MGQQQASIRKCLDKVINRLRLSNTVQEVCRLIFRAPAQQIENRLEGAFPLRNDLKLVRQCIMPGLVLRNSEETFTD